MMDIRENRIWRKRTNNKEGRRKAGIKVGLRTHKGIGGLK